MRGRARKQTKARSLKASAAFPSQILSFDIIMQYYHTEIKLTKIIFLICPLNKYFTTLGQKYIVSFNVDTQDTAMFLFYLFPLYIMILLE